MTAPSLSASTRSPSLQVAPGSVVVVRDEEWLVTGVEQTRDGWLITTQGLSELVRDTTATFYEALDEVVALDPAQAQVVADGSSQYRTARLWLEATLRKTAVPLDDAELTVSTQMLADTLSYQQAAVRQVLDAGNLRPRILLADAVGLGKTLEIGMILAELVRRGRGDRILIVSPRHVLEQMQHEMWCRFALPFVRLDSVGIQRVRQKLPATRNPFTYYKRVIISIDTLKSERYLSHLRRHRWDAVVIDESHNITNSSTQNNRLARVLAPNTDALVLASATPHNGRPESFAELVRLLEPTAVAPDGTVDAEDLRRLVVRRHRHSEQVAGVVGADWAERREPQNWLVPASAEENAIARELDEVWLHPRHGSSPYSGATTALFPWTLAKAFLSSPAALRATVRERLRRLPSKNPSPAQHREIDALRVLEDMSRPALEAGGGKYGRLLTYLREIGVGPGRPTRAVVFAERVPTLRWLRDRLRTNLRVDDAAVRVLHGGLSDEEQREIVESFKQASSPIRVLVTGDVASEGVNLHTQCHELIHFDIPWSLIRIEQRNGRIDRYGQKHPPQITTLLLDPDCEDFSGDLRVLSRLIEKEHEAHTALGDAASLMGRYSVTEEEDEIRRVLAGQKSLDEAVPSVDDALGAGSWAAALLAQFVAFPTTPEPVTSADARAAGTGLPGPRSEPWPGPRAEQPGRSGRDGGRGRDGAGSGSRGGGRLFADHVSFLREALHEAFATPGALPGAGGVSWREYPGQSIIEFTPPPDLCQRLEVLPQTYLSRRRVTDTLKLATSTAQGKALLEAALRDENTTSWPEAHYLGPLHPVLDWASDRALASLGRNQVFAVRGTVDHPTVLLIGTLTNKRGQVVASAFLHAEFPNPANPGFCLVTPHDSAASMVAEVGLDAVTANPGPVADVADLHRYVPRAVTAARAEMAGVFAAATTAVTERVASWSRRLADWEDAAARVAQRGELRTRRLTVAEERALAASMAPDRELVRPLLIVLPTDHPVADAPARTGTPGGEPR